MRRRNNKIKYPDLILCSDLHLREDNPICRTDDFWERQKADLSKLSALAYEAGCPVLCSGDIFHKRPSPRLLSMAITYLPRYFYSIPGNHDLPAHNLKRLDESGFNTLHTALKVRYYEGRSAIIPNLFVSMFPFGKKCTHNTDRQPDNTYVAMIHQFVYKGKKPFPGKLDNVKKVMRQLKGYDLILCGDNHQGFTHKIGKKLFVNPGSFNRQESDKKFYTPRVYFWYKETNTVKPYFFDKKISVVISSTIKEDKKRDDRIEAFVQTMKDNKAFEMDYNFTENMTNYINEFEVGKSVKNKIYEAMEETND